MRFKLIRADDAQSFVAKTHPELLVESPEARDAGGDGSAAVSGAESTPGRGASSGLDNNHVMVRAPSRIPEPSDPTGVTQPMADITVTVVSTTSPDCTVSEAPGELDCGDEAAADVDLVLAVSPSLTIISSAELEVGNEIGAGGFGNVFLGEYYDAPVAVKVLYVAFASVFCVACVLGCPQLFLLTWDEHSLVHFFFVLDFPAAIRVLTAIVSPPLESAADVAAVCCHQRASRYVPLLLFVFVVARGSLTLACRLTAELRSLSTR